MTQASNATLRTICIRKGAIQDMQVSTNKYNIQLPGIQLPSALSDIDFMGDGSANSASKGSSNSSAGVVGNSNSVGSSSAALQVSLSASALNKASGKVTGSPDTQTINPVNHLTSSDIKLVEQTTGVTIVDGSVYDKDGNPSPANSDANSLIASIYEARTYGIENSSGTGRLSVSSDLTTDEMHLMMDNAINENRSAMIGHQSKEVLQKALDVLQSQETGAAQSSGNAVL